MWTLSCFIFGGQKQKRKAANTPTRSTTNIPAFRLVPHLSSLTSSLETAGKKMKSGRLYTSSLELYEPMNSFFMATHVRHISNVP